MADTFEPPLLLEHPSFGVRVLQDAMDAIDFLEEWPLGQRHKLHACACEACFAAYDGRCESEAARKALIAWARCVGVKACGSVMLEAVERAGVVELL